MSGPATPVDDRRRLLAQRIRGARAAGPAGPASDRRSHEEPASFGQRRLWFLQQLQDRQAPYTLHTVRRAAFALDPALMADALNRLVARHDALRTTFRMTDRDLIQVIEGDVRFEPAIVDLGRLPEGEREAAATRMMAETLAEPFDLARGPLFRARLYRLAAADWLTLIAVHHIVFDGPSFDIFFRELDAIYGALAVRRPPDLPPPRAQYHDFAREQRDRLTPERIARETDFWRSELARLPLLDLPTDRPRTAGPSFRGALQRIEVPPELVRRLQARATAARTTLFAVLLAGHWTMLARLCRQTDFGIGLPVTGRDTLARQEAIGFFVDTVVVRIDGGEDPTGDALVAAAREAMKRSIAHRVLPFEMIVERLRPERDLGVNPFFQTGFQFMEYFATETSGDPGVPRSSAMFDLGLDLWFEGEGIAGRLEYNSDLFDPETIATIAETLHAALAWLADGARPLSAFRLGEVLLSARQSILRGPERRIEAATCVEMFETAAAMHPEAIALEGEGASVSYGALRGEVERLAGAMWRRGVRPGDTVALELDRSPDLSRLILASLRLGATFACLDPAWPEVRRAATLDDLAPVLRVGAGLLPTLRAEAEADAGPLRYPRAGDRAYVIFTSGSTGTPKGVEIDHLGLANVAEAQRLAFGLGPGRRVVQLSSPSFDASIFETVLALTAGATLVVAPAGVLAGEELADLLDRARIDVAVAPPSILSTLPEGRGRSLRLICAAGESCPADLARRFAGSAEFRNLYGPTETTIWATSGQRVDGARVAIGTPIANTATLVMDEHLDIQPVGVPGELCIAGPGLARGYLGRPEVTAERFPLSASGARLYRTGDLVRQTRAGDLVFLGRVDRQVKVRGLRIELEEIEVALRASPQIMDAVVDTAEVAGQTALLAYLQLTGGRADDAIEACRDTLRSRLPAYMAPGRYVVVERFARTATGKIDRRALPAPGDERADEAPPLLAATPTEAAVAEIMAHVLRLPGVGVADDFFHVGGHSLAAVQLAARVSGVFGLALTVADVFAHPTVRALAGRVDALAAAPRETVQLEAPLVRLPRGRPELQMRGPAT